MNTKSRVILAGAGPGDPDLITVKALNAIKGADVILYDALANETLLHHARPDCLLVFAGKRKGSHSHTQDEINRMLAFYATRFSVVVRLKGGDPFVFGRGCEEAEYLRQRGITVEIIPGISSAIAAPLAAGIPVTRRGVSDSFWVLTGTTSTGIPSGDLELAARSGATVIILMGLSNGAEIVNTFARHRGIDEPVAIISKATQPDQHVVRGTIGTITSVIEEVPKPGVIVVGPVAALATADQILECVPTEMKVAV